MPCPYTGKRERCRPPGRVPEMLLTGWGPFTSFRVNRRRSARLKNAGCRAPRRSAAAGTTCRAPTRAGGALRIAKAASSPACGGQAPHSKIDRYTVQRMSSLLGIWQFLGCLPILVYGIHPIDCLSLVTHTYCGGDPFSKVDKSSKE